MFVGFLLGWCGGQFTHFDTGWDLLLYLGAFGLFFGGVAAIFSEKTFAKFLTWFY